MAGTPRRDRVEAAGHRLVPHTADCIVEAWGPDLASCLTQALLGVVAEFAHVPAGAEGERVALEAGPGAAADTLVSLVEDVLLAVDTRSVVPARFELAEAPGGRVAGHMVVVPAARVSARGPVPKGVSYHDLSVVAEDGGWRCHALIDV